MHVETASEPASLQKPNEDFIGATDSGVVLLDGAGSGSLVTGCQHGVAWYVRSLGAQLLSLIDRHDRDLVSVLADAIEATAAAHGRTCDLNNPATRHSGYLAALPNSAVFDQARRCAPRADAG